MIKFVWPKYKTLAETYGEGEIKPDLVDLIKKEEE